MSMPANEDMVRGFRDGYDPHSPQPGPNTSRSYRHGFECGRDDIMRRHRFDADTLRRMADVAMTFDADPYQSVHNQRYSI